jgi:pyruvate,water dikinase
MGRAIWDLAREAKRCKPVRERLERHKLETVLAELREEPEAGDFLDRLDRFLAVNGHRAMKEFELRSARWAENPVPVLGMIRNYLLVESNPAAHEEKVRETRSRLEEEVWRILETYPMERTWGLRRRLIRFVVDRVKYFTKLRENSRFYHIMAFSVVRKKILRIEAELMSEGKLRCKDDIFYLLCGEIAGMQKGELGWLDVEDRIRDRRMEHIRLSKTVPPKTINVAVQPKPHAEETEDREALQGQSASPGEYEGTAHVILDPSVDLELKPGEILVAPYTDPAWTPLFLTAGAAVVEVGSYLSHAGTVAREFGMPCVVDVKDCTKRIHSGFRIKVDADRSMVRIIPEQGGEPT